MCPRVIRACAQACVLLARHPGSVRSMKVGVACFLDGAPGGQKGFSGRPLVCGRPVREPGTGQRKSCTPQARPPGPELLTPRREGRLAAPHVSWPLSWAGPQRAQALSTVPLNTHLGGELPSGPPSTASSWSASPRLSFGAPWEQRSCLAFPNLDTGQADGGRAGGPTGRWWPGGGESLLRQRLASGPVLLVRLTGPAVQGTGSNSHRELPRMPGGPLRKLPCRTYAPACPHPCPAPQASAGRAVGAPGYSRGRRFSGSGHP